MPCPCCRGLLLLLFSASLCAATEEGATPAGAAGGGVTPVEGVTAPVDPLSCYLGLYSQYVSRGISYTHEGPAVQGGCQYSHPAGWYLGLWLSNVSNSFIAGGSLESDPYGGYAGTVGDISYDLGFWRWTYLGAKLPYSGQKLDTIELYAAVTYKVLNIKYWREVTDYFGVNSVSAPLDGGYAANGSSRGSNYLESTLSFDVSHGYLLGVHAGRQTVQNYGNLSFSEYRLSLDKDLGEGWATGLSYNDTTANPRAYLDYQGQNAARGKWVGYLKKTF